MTTGTGEGRDEVNYLAGEGIGRARSSGESHPSWKVRAGSILSPGTVPCFLPSWPWEKWVLRGKQVRPHLCPPGIIPLKDGHRRGLEGGQDNVVCRDQLYSDAVGAATVCSGGEPRGGWSSRLLTPEHGGAQGALKPAGPHRQSREMKLRAPICGPAVCVPLEPTLSWGI